MTLHKKPVIEIYDPRRGEDFQLEIIGKKCLSMLEHQLLVVSYYPGRQVKTATTPTSLAFDELNKLIKASLLKLGNVGFFTISPLTKEVRDSELLHLSQRDEMLDTLIGYFDLDSSTINLHFDLRRQKASYAEWVIGSCKAPFKRPDKLPHWYQQAIYWNTDFLFTQVENIESLSLFNGETGELLFFTRIFEGIDELLAPLKEFNKGILSKKQL